MLGGEQTERLDEDRQVLAPLERSDRGDVRPADERGNRRILAGAGGIGQRGRAGSSRPVASGNRSANSRRGRCRTGVHGGATRDRPSQHSPGLMHRPAGQCRMAQEPAVVDRHHLRDAAWRHDVVGAVNDVGPAEEAIDPRSIGDAPTADGRASPGAAVDGRPLAAAIGTRRCTRRVRRRRRRPMRRASRPPLGRRPCGARPAGRHRRRRAMGSWACRG